MTRILIKPWIKPSLKYYCVLCTEVITMLRSAFTFSHTTGSIYWKTPFDNYTFVENKEVLATFGLKICSCSFSAFSLAFLLASLSSLLMIFLFFLVRPSSLPPTCRGAFTRSIFSPFFRPLKNGFRIQWRLFIHDVKKIKGTANKIGLKNVMCKQSLTDSNMFPYD